MSFRCQSHRLVPRAAVEKFQEWVYCTDHPIEAVLSKNYFQGTQDCLRKGDLIVAYAVGERRMQRIEVVVSRSDRDTVVVGPFAATHQPGAIQVQEAELSTDKPKPKATYRSDDPNAPRSLELRHLKHGKYRILNADGDVVIGDIAGHQAGVDLLGRIRNGKIAIADARREVENANLAAFGPIEHGVGGSGS